MLFFSFCSHEYTSGYYRVSVYFLSKILSDIITQRTIPTILFTCVIYFMIGKHCTRLNLKETANDGSLELRHPYVLTHSIYIQPTKRKTYIMYVCSVLTCLKCLCFAGLKPTAAAFFIFMLTVILVACTAAAMAMAISADQSVVAVANIFMTISFIFMMASIYCRTSLFTAEEAWSFYFKWMCVQIFSGLLVNLKSIMDWLSWLKYLSIPRYGLEVWTFTSYNWASKAFCWDDIFMMVGLIIWTGIGDKWVCGAEFLWKCLCCDERPRHRHPHVCINIHVYMWYVDW